MSDFDAFGAADAPQQEEDPAADFLAREQDQLAGLEDDNLGGDLADQAAPAGDDFMAQFGSETTTQEPAADSLDMFSAEAPSTEAAAPAASNDDIMAQFGSSEPAEPTANTDTSNDFFVAPGESSTDDFMGGSGAMPVIDDLDDRLNQEDAPSDPYSSVRGFDEQRAEPEKLRVWREEQVTLVEQKDADEAEKMAEWREIAKKELDDWYKHQAEQFEKTKKNNREGENEFIKERDDTLPGHEWERICRVCEFNPKSNRSQKDASRMRGILLQLKQNPITAK